MRETKRLDPASSLFVLLCHSRESGNPAGESNSGFPIKSGMMDNKQFGRVKNEALGGLHLVEGGSYRPNA